jgi:hypothetical protein
MAVDAYEVSGEFLDVLSGPAWEALRVPVSEALRGAAPQEGPFVDVGAGTGLGMRVVADACVDAQILAVEPSSVLRAVLLSRVAADADLRARVTVVAADALGADLPERLGAVVAVNMIGHLAAEERREFWARVRERLVPGAPLVVNLQPPAEPVAIPPATFVSVRVGHYTYEGSGSAEPAGPDSVIWRMRYRTLDERGDAMHDRVIEYPWYVVSPAGLLRELAAAGLTGQVGAFDVVRAARTE